MCAVACSSVYREIYVCYMKNVGKNIKRQQTLHLRIDFGKLMDFAILIPRQRERRFLFLSFSNFRKWNLKPDSLIWNRWFNNHLVSSQLYILRPILNWNTYTHVIPMWRVTGEIEKEEEQHLVHSMWIIETLYDFYQAQHLILHNTTSWNEHRRQTGKQHHFQ